MTTGAILVLNTGSSSVKFRVFNMTKTLPLCTRGKVIKIGTRPQLFLDGKKIKTLPQTIDQSFALTEIMHYINGENYAPHIKIVGHRIVHGGDKFKAPTYLTDQVINTLEKLIPLAPLHQAHNLFAVRHLKSLYPKLTQIGCFDTAFHAQHPPLFTHYALPKYLRNKGIRRYGFHGLSYEWIVHTLQTQHPAHAQGRIVAAHLGNGASLCAIKAGRSIDTTMGLTALDGLPMGTRCGSIDPGVILYMLRELGMDATSIEHILSQQSGLKGLSGISHDVKDLLIDNSKEAKFALKFFAMMTAQHIGRMAVALKGIDTIVFTGGIGEHAAPIREMILSHLAWLKPFTVFIIEANEERMIAKHCMQLYHSNLNSNNS